MNILTLNISQKLFIALQIIFCTNVTAGAYFFADEVNGIDLVAHPSTYTGSQGTVTVRVCIDPASPNATDMAYSVNNSIDTFNQLASTTGNVKLNNNNNIPSGAIDFESVALHEIGHCLGMAHTNAASESGETGANQNYTKATDGSNNSFDLNAGADGVIGSSDDIRDDDINLVWFRKSNNNPFTIDAIIDSTTYSNRQSDLPQGHEFAANADRTVAKNVYGLAKTEAVMQQGTYYDEAQRSLGHDDVATLRYAASGKNELENDPNNPNAKDNYDIELVYGGITTSNCDISMAMTTTNSLAFCSARGSLISENHVRLSSTTIEFGNGFNWFFNAYDSDDDGLSDDEEVNTYGTSPHNADSDGDNLSDYEEVVLYKTNPNDSDSDNDFINDFDEVSYGSDPNDDASWPNYADGDIAPLGAPDGVVNAGDYLIAQRISLGEISATSLELSHGDLYPSGSPDGVIDVSDLILLLQLTQQ